MQVEQNAEMLAKAREIAAKVMADRGFYIVSEDILAGRDDDSNVVQAALAALTAAGQDGWRSMDSAAKDGTRVLLAFNGNVGEFCCHLGSWTRPGGASLLVTPDAWRPLPTPPADAIERDAHMTEGGDDAHV